MQVATDVICFCLYGYQVFGTCMYAYLRYGGPIANEPGYREGFVPHGKCF